MVLSLKDTDYQAILEVFSKYPEIEQAILYGSRAMGTHRPASDIDLTLVGENLNHRYLAKLENELDDLLLPYTFDISIRSQIRTPSLLEHIERVGVLFYSPN
ncbi:nucleotidyltransferase domain-containing protein [Rubritalea marina]|uniref:nucleotidyltransferase domain-containing protein n=1 Tax=Rubritalea marina TaxID=361055 RepID=UPI00035CEF70|nr:nucleotidyltransferase domain-containing protein [Rubritalea marina]